MSDQNLRHQLRHQKRYMTYAQARIHLNAHRIKSLCDLQDAPAERCICFETRNHGWIFSPRINNYRSILVKE
jgi:hypothetical protein